MSLLTYIILLPCFLHVTVCEDCVTNNLPEYIAWEKEIMIFLHCNNLSDPPSENTSVTFNFRFTITYFNFDSNEEVFSIQNWMFISWQDDRLKWDPENYFNINETEITNTNIWIPRFSLVNNADHVEYFNGFDFFRCLLKSTGDIVCKFWMTHNAWCDVRLTNWPYDKQECSLEFMSSNSMAVNNKINFSSHIIFMASMFGGEWHVLDYKQEKNYIPGRQFKMTFVLVREAAGLAAIIIYPAVILTVLSIISLFLDVRRNMRLSVSCFSLLCHYYFLTELAANIPRENAFPPTILLYYRGSLVLTVLIILFTFFLAAVCKLKSQPQHYVKSVNDFVYESYGAYVVFPRWDSDDSKGFSEEWTNFVNVINSVFGFIIVIAYISLYCSLMPKPVSVK